MLSLKNKYRLSSWFFLAILLFAIIAIVSPHQLTVSIYKLALVCIAAITGYHLDRALFPYSSPGSYLQKDWKNSARYDGTDKPEYPIVTGCELIFSAVILRRALIVTAVILGVTLGL